MPNDKLKRAISVALSFSMLTSAPQLGNAADLVPNNGMISSTPPPPCQTVIAPSDAAVGFSLKSFEAKISKALKPSKNIETEKVKRKTLATDDSGSCGNGVTYKFEANSGTLTISGTGSMTDYKVNNMPWTWYSTAIQTVVIEDGVTSIGNYAFYGCSGLTSTTISDSVTEIGEQVFSGCDNLVSFQVSESNLHYASFNGILYNKNFTSIVLVPKAISGKIVLHDGLTSIESTSFYNCKGLTSINIPNSVSSIGNHAFYGCSGLTSITIPDGVTTIENGMFEDCVNLTSVKMSNDVTSIGSFAFCDCNSLTSITIPDKVNSIEEYAFKACTTLTSITIPDSVTFIGNNAFRDCSGLTFVSIGKGVTKIDTAAFAGCNSLISLELNNNYATSGYISTAFSGFTSKPTVKSITLGSSITEIGNSAFYGFDALETVTIPASVDSVGSYAFRYCKELSSVTYMGTTAPKSGSSVFDYCDKLTIVNVPQGYNKNTFCGKPVNKTAIPDTPGEGETPSGGELPDPTGEGDPSTSEVVDSSSEDDNDPAPPPGDSNKGSSNAGVIAGSVVAAVAVVAAVVVTAVMYVKKLACFGRAVGGSTSEG